MTQDRHILTFGNLAEETPGALTWDHLMAESMGRRACSLPVQDLALISPQANGSQIGVSTLDLSPELWIQTQHLHLTIIHCQFKLNMLEIRHWTSTSKPVPPAVSSSQETANPFNQFFRPEPLKASLAPFSHTLIPSNPTAKPEPQPSKHTCFYFLLHYIPV